MQLELSWLRVHLGRVDPLAGYAEAYDISFKRNFCLTKETREYNIV
jgi:hypothetical protein